MTRMFLAALSALIATMMVPVASAQNYGGGGGRASVHVRFEEHMRYFEQGGSRGRNQSYRPAHSVSRDILQIVLGFAANHPRRQSLNHAGFCPSGGELGRLPNGQVACITSVQWDPTIRHSLSCPNGGDLQAVFGVSGPQCVTGQTPPGPEIRIATCSIGRHLGWVPGVDHQVCVRD